MIELHLQNERYMSDNSVKTCFFGKQAEEYRISYQYDLNIMFMERLRRLHVPVLTHFGHLSFDSQIAIGQAVAVRLRKIRALAKQSAGEKCLMICGEVFHHLEMFVWQFRL